MRSSIVALAAMLLGTVPAAAIAQNVSPGTPQFLNEISTPLTAYNAVKVNEVITDATGNRLVVGTASTSSGSDGFLTILNNRGLFIAHHTIDLGVNDDTTAIVIDGSTVYVGTNTDGIAVLQKFDLSGNLVWTENAGVSSLINDLVVMSGTPVSAGSFQGRIGLLNWKTDGTGYASSLSWSYTGEIKSAALAPNGSLYITGGGTISTTVAGPNPFLGMISANRTAGTFSYYGLTGMMSDVKVEPVSGLAVSGGYYNGTATRPFTIQTIGTYTEATNSIALATTGFSYNYDAIGGAYLQAVETGIDGFIYLLINAGVSTGPRRVDLYAHKKNPSANGMTGAWSAIVPRADPAANQTGFDLVAVTGGRITVAVLDESIVSSTDGNYQAYNLYTWSSTGTAEHRSVLGSFDQPIPASYNWDTFSRNSVVFAAGTFSMFAPTLNSQAGFWGGAFVAGPDDSYKTNEDVPVVVNTRKFSLLDNDANGFVLGWTAQLKPGSETNLSSVTVDSDGKFSAVPVANFNGTASFQYDVYSGATYVATHTASILVRPINDAPTAVNDAFVVAANSRANPLDVLANDFDVDGDAIRIVSKTAPLNGRASFSADRMSFVYKPNPGFVGTDTFTYTIKDVIGRASTATVTVTVQ